MRLNVQKFKVDNFGRKNLGFKYFLQDSNQEVIEVEENKTEKDLGLSVSYSLSWKDLIHSAISKANKIIGMLKNKFINRDIKLW